MKQFPKLSNFNDGEPSLKKPARTGRNGRPVGPRLKLKIRWPLVIMIGIVVFVVLIYLPDAKHGQVPLETEKNVDLPDRPTRAPAAEAGRTKVMTQSIPIPDPPAVRSAVSVKKKPPAQPGVKVIGNRDTKRYHLPGMMYYDRIKAYHRVVFNSEKEAINAGYIKGRQ